MRLWPHRREPGKRTWSGDKISVGVLGATDIVGQQLVALLDGHPWFEVRWLGTSERSEGRRYGELPWRLPGKVPDGAAHLELEKLRPVGAPHLLFSVLDAAAAGAVERDFALAGHYVVSSARNFRMDPLVPLLVPAVNAQHLGLVAAQRREKGWSGAIVTNPNGSTLFLAVVLRALCGFDVQRATVTGLEAVSDAGHPRVGSGDVVSQVTPSTERSGEDIEAETQKILGRLVGDSIEAHPVRVSAEGMRFPVLDSHMKTVSVELGSRVSREQIVEALREFSATPQAFPLPSAPVKPIVVHGEHDRPPPRLETERARGMVAHVGGLGTCSVLDYKFVIFEQNAIRGAAAAAVLNAELIVARSLAIRQMEPQAE
jgi:aspartate-semialdehyde dehydrogenase